MIIFIVLDRYIFFIFFRLSLIFGGVERIMVELSRKEVFERKRGGMEVKEN